MRLLIPRLCTIAVFTALAAPKALSQQGGATVRVTGRVSPVVAISAASPARIEGADAHVSTSNAGPHALTLSLSGAGVGVTKIDLPLRLRSNIGFTLAASCVTREATLSALSVVEVGGGGRFVHPGAAGRVEVTAALDGRLDRLAGAGVREYLSSPVTILGGPPISMSGTLDSPDNYIEVVLRVVLDVHDAGNPGYAELRITASPNK